jgi:hypothetical protein
VQGIVNVIPTKPVDVTDEWIYSAGTAKLSIALGPEASTGNWYTSSAATGTPVASGASYTTASLSATQVYYTRATTAAGCLSDTTWVYARVITDLVSPSNVKTDIIRKEGTTSLTQIGGLSSSEKTTQYYYLDGIGRTVQAVVTQASPDEQQILDEIALRINPIKDRLLDDEDEVYKMRAIYYDVEYGNSTRESERNPNGISQELTKTFYLVDPNEWTTDPIYGNPGSLSPEGAATPYKSSLDTGNNAYLTIYFQRLPTNF